MPSNNTEKLLLMVFGGCALLILAISVPSIVSSATSITGWSNLLVAGLFAGVTALSHKFPIHIRRRTKVHMNLVPLFLSAALLPAPLAATSAFLGTVIGNLLVQKEQGLWVSDILVGAGRRTLVIFLSALMAHSGVASDTLGYFSLFPVAVFMFFGEMITFSLQLAVAAKEPFFMVVPTCLREATVVESVQYLIGILGVLAAMQGYWALVLLALPTILAYLAFKSAKEMRDSTQQILEGMADTVDLRDPYTGGHSRRVADISKRILKEMNTPGPEADLIWIAARVHDIGKLAIADQILFKPDSHTPDETKIMRSHVEQGAQLLMRYPDFARGADIVKHHHERWDGKGYPDGLQGLTIPFGARVLTVADSFDAMITDRPYRRGMSPEQAVTILRSGAGKQWDPEIVEALARVVLVDPQSLPMPKPQLMPRVAVS